MDWTYKHFNQQAVFNEPMPRVIEAARAVLAESLEYIEDGPDGFVARGTSGFHAAQATLRFAPVAAGTEVNVDLEVKRFSALWGYVLWDPFGFYNSRIDKWFARISERLGQSETAAVVSKSTMSYRVQRGCLAGCLVWIVLGAFLGVAGAAADHALFPQLSASTPGPVAGLASLIALAAGILAFLYVRYPEGSLAKSIRSRLHLE